MTVRRNNLKKIKYQLAFMNKNKSITKRDFPYIEEAAAMLYEIQSHILPEIDKHSILFCGSVDYDEHLVFSSNSLLFASIS